MLEELETMLAGRAAEEIVFGADDVGAGAGGPSRTSDLAVATRLATQIVCRSGLGDDGALHWTERPTRGRDRSMHCSERRTLALRRLQAHRVLLDEIVGILEEKQEVAGAELRRLLARNEPRSVGEVAPA